MPPPDDTRRNMTVVLHNFALLYFCVLNYTICQHADMCATHRQRAGFEALMQGTFR
jgi:hypothetical protein